MICRKCGKENSDFSQKCYFCGDNLSTQSTLNNQNVYSNTMQSSVNTINSNNNLNVFGVPGIQNNSNVNSIHPIVEKEEIKFDSPVVESSPVIHQNTYNLGQSFNSVNTINSTNNINNVGTIQANPQMQQGSLINNVNPQGINNNIVTSDNNVIKNEPIINQQTNLQTNNDAFEKNNNIQSNVQVLEQKAVPSVSNKKTNNKKISNTLFIVAALLVVVALILIAIPILSKKTNRLEDINNNSKLNVNDNGEITGKLKIVHLNSNIEYDVKSNYYNNNGVYNIKLDLSLNNQLINSYIEVSSKSLNIYIPSEFIDLFGKTKSEETQWIKYSIDFINEIGINNIKEKNSKLYKRLLNGILNIDGFEVYGD